MWLTPQYLFFYMGNIIVNIQLVKVEIIMIDFSPMWKTMEDKGITQYKLLKSGIDNKTLDSLKKNNNITLLTLEKLCEILDCSPNEVVRFIRKKRN